MLNSIHSLTTEEALAGDFVRVARPDTGQLVCIPTATYDDLVRRSVAMGGTAEDAVRAYVGFFDQVANRANN